MANTVTSIHLRPPSHRRVRTVEGMHELTLILGARDMVVGLAPHVGKVVHPCRVLIYCNSHALGHGTLNVLGL
jgi:hypothetical protein